MSDTDNDDQKPTAPSELELLRNRAKALGITFSGNTGIDTLKAKIAEKTGEGPKSDQTEQVQDEEDDSEVAALKAQIAQLTAQRDGLQIETEVLPSPLNPLAGDVAGQKPMAKMSERERMRREALKLVRVRIQNLDPKKKDLHGEIFTVGNRFVGTVKKFIPYGEATDDGYHIPNILFEALKERKFLHIRTFKDRQTKQDRVETSWQREFALEVLPQLTPDELAKLAAAQMAANG